MLASRLLATFAALLLAVPTWAQTSPGNPSDGKKSPEPLPKSSDIGPKAPIMNAPPIMETPGKSSGTSSGGSQVPIRLYGGKYVSPYLSDNPYRANPYKDNNPYRDNNPYGKAP
jgi:hypothetical protein